MLVVGFCLFKQKTAYEMRISDWSSDVCSSDLGLASFLKPERLESDLKLQHSRWGRWSRSGIVSAIAAETLLKHNCAGIKRFLQRSGSRSEEHTSELQSLMRISYAVFCLKKKQ